METLRPRSTFRENYEMKYVKRFVQPPALEGLEEQGAKKEQNHQTARGRPRRVQ